jgi:hypothetical protein
MNISGVLSRIGELSTRYRGPKHRANAYSEEQNKFLGWLVDSLYLLERLWSAFVTMRA